MRSILKSKQKEFLNDGVIQTDPCIKAIWNSDIKWKGNNIEHFHMGFTESEMTHITSCQVILWTT